VEYLPDADCELWDAFLWRVLGGDEDLYGYARRLVGYLLTGKTSEQVLHFLYGLGANGKSVFCEIVEALLGDYAIVVSPELVMMRRHSGIPNDIARLRGVRAAFMNETSQGSRFDEAKLKDLTGGDTLSGRFLHQEFFDFPPTHKLIIRGNHKPVIAGTDEGIWRRLRLVPFVVTIPVSEQDQQLIEKLRSELPGILRWAVQGCLEWQRQGLNPPAPVVEAVRQYREESDTLGRFITECCEVSNLSQVKSSVFFNRYQQFAEAAGERWMPAKDLPHEMQRRGVTYKRDRTGTRLYIGIELRSAEDWRAGDDA
jgi:putative DNA primase/helicase